MALFFRYRIYFKRGTLLLLVKLGLIYCLVLTCLNAWELYQIQWDDMDTKSSADEKTNKSVPVVWIYNKGANMDHLEHVFIVFRRLGFRIGTNESN